MKKFITSKNFTTFLGILLFFALWFLFALVIDERTMVFPSPIETFSFTVELLGHAYLYQCLATTFLKMIIGFAIAFVIAVILGLIAGKYSQIKHILAPTVSVMKSIPTAALVFFFLVLVGAKSAPILMVILISFPVLYEAVVRGEENIDKNILNAAKVDGGRWSQKLCFIILPEVFPYLMIGVASSFSLSFKIEIMAEILTGDTTAGLGSAILAAQRNNPADMRPIFAYSFIAIVFIFLVSLVLHLLENKFKKKLNDQN